MHAPSPFDPASNELRPLAEYTTRLPSRRRGRRLNRATIWRWALRGARGGTIRLRTVVLGGGRFTSDADVAAFMAALASAAERRPADCSTPPAAEGLPPEELSAIQNHFATGGADS